MKVLSYAVEPEICDEMRERIKDMPNVHDALSDYHKALRIGYTIIEDSDMDNGWRDEKFLDVKTKAFNAMVHELRWYPWVTNSILERAYHE